MLRLQDLQVWLQAQQELVKNFNLMKHGVQTNVYKKVLYENALVKNLMSANGYIEHSGRLGLLLQSIEEGKSIRRRDSRRCTYTL